MAELVRDLRGQGHKIHHVDIGGGLGIPYHADEDAPPLPVDYARIVTQASVASSVSNWCSSRAG